MNRFYHNVRLRIVKSINAVMITIPFALCWYLYYADRISQPYYSRGNWLVIALFLVVYVSFGRLYDAFYISIFRISEIVYSQILALLVTNGIMYIIICLLSRRLPSVLPGMAAIGGEILLSVVWAAGSHRWYFKSFPPQATAVIYDRRHGLDALIDEYGLSKKYEVKLHINVEECLKDLDILREMQTVFLSGIHSHDRNIILELIRQNLL